MSINGAERKQDKFDTTLGALSIYPAKNKKYLEPKNKLLNNAKKFYKGREKIIEGFKNISIILWWRRRTTRTRHEEEENKIRDENGLIDYKRLERLIFLKSRNLNNDSVGRHFQVQDLVSLLKKLKKSKNTPERNNILVNSINSELRDLKGKIEDMSEQEKETEKPKWNSRYCWNDFWV